MTLMVFPDLFATLKTMHVLFALAHFCQGSREIFFILIFSLVYLKKRMIPPDIVVPEVPLRWLFGQSTVSFNKAFTAVTVISVHSYGS